MSSHARTFRWRAWIILFMLLSASTSCGRHSNPEAEYERARSTFRKGDLAGAERQAKKGYDDFHQLGADWAWKFLILRALAVSHQSRYEEALRLIAAEPTQPPSVDLAVRKLWLEGLANAQLHQFEKAEQSFRNSEPLCKAAESPACANVATARGTMKMERGQYAEAQTDFRQVLGPARASGDQLWLANAMLDLCWSAEHQTHFDEALDWASRSSQIASSQGFGVVSEKALGNMGWAYYRLGDRDKAIEMFEEAGKRAKELGDVADQVKWITDAGYVHMDAHDFGVAEQSFRESLKLATEIKSREDVVDSDIALAFVSEQTDKLDDGKHYSNEVLAMARADGNRDDETWARLVLGRIAVRQHDLQTAETNLHQVAESPDTPVFLKWEAEHSLAQLYEDRDEVSLADREYRIALSTFESARSGLQRENSRLPFLTNATGIYDNYLHFLLAQHKTNEALQVANYSRARTLREGLGLLKKSETFHPDPLNASAIARQAGGTILFYWLGAKESYLWTITPQKVVLSSLPASSEIDAMVGRYRKALLGPVAPLESSNTDGSALYRILIAPVEAMIPPGDKVFIVPDGSLNTLNFETLLAPNPAPHYWIEDVTVAAASSLRLLASAGQAPPARKRTLLLLGNPVLSNPDYPELRKAAAEMEGIEKHFAPQEQRIFAREQATPGAYREARPEQFSYVHFVAHGTASRISPLESAIVLSGTNAQDDSFKLYARDIIQRPLHAELVTISTCYGAGTRAYSGEGLVGLSWAFLRAGAHNVIGALWEVSDVSTPQLMDDLYGELQRGEGPDVALRKAKLKLLHSKGSFRRPFYWAPFQLYTGS